MYVYCRQDTCTYEVGVHCCVEYVRMYGYWTARLMSLRSTAVTSLGHGMFRSVDLLQLFPSVPPYTGSATLANTYVRVCVRTYVPTYTCMVCLVHLVAPHCAPRTDPSPPLPPLHLRPPPPCVLVCDVSPHPPCSCPRTD